MKEDHIEKIAIKKTKHVLKFPHFATLILLAFVLVVIHLTRGNVESQNLVEKEQIGGKWVYDNSSYPLYKEEQCSFMENDFACETYGRKDLKYQNWRWQPHHCNLPRFNGTALLEKLRGKKLIFVGDSLNRNQWKSMLCLIDSYLPPLSNKSVVLEGNLLKFASDVNNVVCRSTMWSTDHTCYKETEPNWDEKYWPSGANRGMMEIVESTIEKLSKRGVKVEYLNITQLSAYREDGHPSVHRTFWNAISKEQLKNITLFADCMHWCLPGVPDVWNQILYSYIINS
ncbi:hypothetical protein MIMGU_mgv11b017857mg [Erythranthe guttata]|uniref:Uncharacterized protein n=1 Tax=Erythranthe guttata TaxID=4155 RepID=A0A022RST1_ERYGU|nr:hypothetical protein MIMGU_mgv11b017857mg [Erythranthe guttata]